MSCWVCCVHVKYIHKALNNNQHVCRCCALHFLQKSSFNLYNTVWRWVLFAGKDVLSRSVCTLRSEGQPAASRRPCLLIHGVFHSVPGGHNRSILTSWYSAVLESLLDFPQSSVTP